MLLRLDTTADNRVQKNYHRSTRKQKKRETPRVPKVPEDRVLKIPSFYSHFQFDSNLNVVAMKERGGGGSGVSYF